MANYGHHDDSLFTIEQIELLRRLRNSGITRMQLINAFDRLDRLDEEFGDTYTMPLSLTHKYSNGSDMSNDPSFNGDEIGKPYCTVKDPGSATTSHQYTSNGTHLVNMMSSPTQDDDSEAFASCIRVGREVMYDEIRRHVNQYAIKQHHISITAGISQAYVSKYLRGDYSDMSDRVCQAIYTWYMNSKKRICSAMLSKSPLCSSTYSKLLMSSEELGAIPRRERFMFRASHIDVLERAFREDPYPNSERREAIAGQCNDSVVSGTGRELMEKERVNANIVCNWFANRRKDLKRLTKDIGSMVHTDTLRNITLSPVMSVVDAPSINMNFRPNDILRVKQEYIGESSVTSPESDQSQSPLPGGSCERKKWTSDNHSSSSPVRETKLNISNMYGSVNGQFVSNSNT